MIVVMTRGAHQMDRATIKLLLIIIILSSGTVCAVSWRAVYTATFANKYESGVQEKYDLEIKTNTSNIFRGEFIKVTYCLNTSPNLLEKAIAFEHDIPTDFININPNDCEYEGHKILKGKFDFRNGSSTFSYIAKASLEANNGSCNLTASYPKITYDNNLLPLSKEIPKLKINIMNNLPHIDNFTYIPERDDEFKKIFKGSNINLVAKAHDRETKILKYEWFENK